MSEDKKLIYEIIERQYGGYRGNAYRDLQRIHRILWRHYGDERFLAFLQDQEQNNPVPVYNPITIK